MSDDQIIAVDLDGTLTLTDTLHESVLTLVRNKPYFLLLLPFWLFKGIAYLKQKVAENSELDVTTLPYNQPLIDWLKEEKQHGRKIVLCTAANEKIAKAVVSNFDLFDTFIASDVSFCANGIYNILEQKDACTFCLFICFYDSTIRSSY